MRFKSIANVLIIGAAAKVTAAEHDPQADSQIKEARQFGPIPNDNYAKLGFYKPRDSFSYETSYGTEHGPELDAYPPLHPEDESFNEIEGPLHTDTHMPLSKSADSVAAEKSDSGITSPAMSALTLIGFLYFLNLIQDVLQGNNGRKRRDTEQYLDGTEGMDDYLSAIEGLIKKVAEVLPSEGGGVEGRSLTDIFSYLTSPSDKSVEERTFGVFTFMSSILGRVMEFMGFGQKASSRQDLNLGDSSDYTKFWNIFGERIGLVARIMDFLNDPSPSRIGRSYNEYDKSDTNPDEEYAEALELSDEDMQFLPSDSVAEEKSHSRKKRFSTDEMNIWYSEGHDPYHTKQYADGENGQLVGMIFNLFRSALQS